MLDGPRSMGRVGKYFLDHLINSDRIEAGFISVGGDYMRGQWPERFARLADRVPANGFDQLVTFCSIRDKQLGGASRLISPWMFYEMASIPKPLVEQLNGHDLIYACSSFVRDVMNWSGVKTPVGVLGHGYDDSVYSLVERQVPDVVRFLCIAEVNARKNLPFLIRCFEKAFADRSDVELVIKVGFEGGELLKTLITGPNITIVNQELVTEQDLCELYRSCHCFVLPTRGEGFGMPILEAMATGMPVIVTDYSGHLDFCNENNSYLIEIKGLVPCDTACFPNVESEWANPSEEHLIHLLREVADDYEKALRVGAAAHASVRDEWTWHRQLSARF